MRPPYYYRWYDSSFIFVLSSIILLVLSSRTGATTADGSATCLATVSNGGASLPVAASAHPHSRRRRFCTSIPHCDVCEAVYHEAGEGEVVAGESLYCDQCAVEYVWDGEHCVQEGRARTEEKATVWSVNAVEGMVLAAIISLFLLLW